MPLQQLLEMGVAGERHVGGQGGLTRTPAPRSDTHGAQRCRLRFYSGERGRLPPAPPRPRPPASLRAAPAGSGIPSLPRQRGGEERIAVRGQWRRPRLPARVGVSCVGSGRALRGAGSSSGTRGGVAALGAVVNPR